MRHDGDKNPLSVREPAFDQATNGIAGFSGVGPEVGMGMGIVRGELASACT